MLADQGHTILGVLATGGEASELPAAGSLIRARRRRLAKYERALDLLGARNWTWLDPDAGWVDWPEGPTVAGADPVHLQAAVTRLIDQHSPEIVLTIGADGLTGHPDHIAINRAVTAAIAARPVRYGALGARLRAADVQAGRDLISTHTTRRATGSGLVTGTDAPLITHDVQAYARIRREALDIYRDGLGSRPLKTMLDSATRISDSLLLRAIFEAEGWQSERYERIDILGADQANT
jgi:LmbE family N-acetylglucosaminyl deacetylase